MKNPLQLIAILLLGTVLTTTAPAQAVEKKVALRALVNNARRYATTAPKGGLTISSRTVTDRAVFTLIDSNGGDLADGDEVQIKAASADGGADTYWQETEDKVRRDRSGSTFKVKKTAEGISLQAPTGKFLSSEYQADHIPVTDAPEKVVVFEVTENPTVTAGAEAKQTE